MYSILASLTANTGMIFFQIELNENKTKYCLKSKEKRKKKERKKVSVMLRGSVFPPVANVLQICFLPPICHQINVNPATQRYVSGGDVRVFSYDVLFYTLLYCMYYNPNPPPPPTMEPDWNL
jgi:hypothetical protein